MYCIYVHAVDDRSTFTSACKISISCQRGERATVAKHPDCISRVDE
jgi:hypothetical protein